MVSIRNHLNLAKECIYKRRDSLIIDQIFFIYNSSQAIYDLVSNYDNIVSVSPDCYQAETFFFFVN